MLARRQGTKPSHNKTSNGNANGKDTPLNHSNNDRATSTRSSPTTSTSQRRLTVSFLAGACCMGALLFFLRDCPSPFLQSSLRSDAIATTKSPTDTIQLEDWTWFEGDVVNQFYNELEKDTQRDPTNIDAYAVHRWMGTDHSTRHHYDLIMESIVRYTGKNNLKVLDAGCGLGATMKWMEERNPTWTIMGRTLSEEQVKFIEQKIPPHKFGVELKSFDDLGDETYDVIYSIEAMIHSFDIRKTIKAWAAHLNPKQGSIVVIDDFLMPGADRNTSEMQLFQRGWMANSLLTVSELNEIGRQYGIKLVESRDILAEWDIVKLNYKNKPPKLTPELFNGKQRTHQAWIGSKLRHKLTVEGKVGYFMLVFQRVGARTAFSWKQPEMISQELLQMRQKAVEAVTVKPPEASPTSCQIVPTGISSRNMTIVPKKECLSGWYCCDKAQEYLEKLKNRTHRFGFLKMDSSLFGNYMDVFAKHLNQFYESMPETYDSGLFLDIGATGSTVSGMQQVTTKFQHFAGPLDYWKLDSDKGASFLSKTIYCDICDCPNATTCGFDVTFSHTVLEHAARPDKAFDTIARITKKGGLTMHLVPWSYQYHATPDDYYRFSHSALKVLMEDRGFETLEIGYDLCSKPEGIMDRVDEHYDFIWLTYVVARKL